MFNMLKEIGGLKSKRKEQKMLQYKIGLKKNQIELAVVKQIYFMQITINAKVGLPWWSTD